METPPITTNDVNQQQADSNSPQWMKRVPMVTGVLAGLAGFLTVRSANMSNQANYNGTMAVLHQSKSSDAWAEYQADSMKRHINETALESAISDSAARSKLQAENDDYVSRQAKAKKEAENEAAFCQGEMVNGQQKLSIKGLLDYASTAAQVGIALASVAALTKKSAAFYVGVFTGFLALLITAYAMAEPYFARLFHMHI